VARRKILVVDDEAETREVCRRVFNKKRYRVQFATDGQKALEIVRHDYFPVVLADLKMPGIDGLTLLKRIKEERPQTEVIIITGYGCINTVVEAMRIGAYDYIIKPFDIDELISVVDKCLEKQRLAIEVGQSREVVALYEVSKAIRSIVDLGKLLKTILKLACETMVADGGVLVLFEKDEKKLFPKFWIGVNRELAKIVEREIEKRIPYWIAGDNSPFLFTDRAGNNKSCFSGIAIPLKIKDRIIGAISVINLEGNRDKFRRQNSKLLTIFATNASLAIENVKVYEKLEQEKKDLEKAHEQLRELDRLKSEFVVSLSGGLREALAAIQEAMDLLAEKLTKEIGVNEERLIEIARNSTGRMRELIDDLPDFSIVEGNAIKLKMRKVSLSEIVSGVVREFKALFNKKRISLVTLLPEGRAEVFGDFYRLKQVVANLIKNAVKFTAPRGKLAVRVEESEKEVRVCVEDTGTFDKLRQGNQSGIVNGGGFELDLSIAKAIVAAHRGEVCLNRKPGKGRKFTFTIPKEKRRKPRPCQSEFPDLFDYSVS